MAKRKRTSIADGSPGDPLHVSRTGQGSTTRERILDSAEQIFAQKGFDGARIDDFAIAVGIRKPSVLHHFESKDQIYGEIEARIYDDLLMALVGKTEMPENAEQRLLLTIDAALDFAAARPTAGRILLRTIANCFSRSKHADNVVASLMELWRRRVHAAQESGSLPPVSADLLLVMLGGTILTFVASHAMLQTNYDPDKNLVGELRVVIHSLLRPANP